MLAGNKSADLRRAFVQGAEVGVDTFLELCLLQVITALVDVEVAVAGVTKGTDADAMLLLQGVATSIDALSVGFAIAEYEVHEAIICSAIVGTVTFGLCMLGLKAGKHLGVKLAGKSIIIGGVILVIIGIEILLKHLLNLG